MKTIRVPFRALLLIVAMATFAFAQSSGSITGTVKDTKGAMVSGANVTAADPSQGVNQKTQTNDMGVFSFPQILAGTYTISVEMSGFKKVDKENVVLTYASKVNVGDIILEVGNVTETVTIQAAGAQLQMQSESGERSDLVSGKQLREIGLNGRNVTDLAKLIPGVISGGAGSGSGASTVNNVVGSFNINGTRSDMHEYTVDGVSNFNLGNNTGALVSLNPDALQEVKILTSNYQAEYGRSGGGFIALVTRGGTNEYHGSGRYFRRHESMNANNYFNNLKGIARPLYRFNFMGWDFGGPVPFLGTKKERKIFFFINQEYYKQMTPNGAHNMRTPTDAEKAGDFSQSVDGSAAGNKIIVKDPLTGLQFTNNTIPSNRFYGPGLAVLKLFPQPNTTLGGNAYNYTTQTSDLYPRRENIIRVDYQIAPMTRLSGRWVYNYDHQELAYGTTTATFSWPLTVVDRFNGPGNVLSFTLTHSFSATLVNEFTYGQGRGGVTIQPSGDAALRSTTGITTPLLYPDANTGNFIPTMSFGGVSGMTAPSTSVYGPFVQKFIINNFIDNLSKVWREHTFKVGLYYQRASNSSNSQQQVEGVIAFDKNTANPLDTGYPFANALLGIYSTYNQASKKIYQSYFYQDISWYAQDTWKVTPRLTLDLGVRFSIWDPFYNTAGPEAYFNPGLFDPAKAVRLYKPVCIAGVCSTIRAFDPATAGAPSMANTLPAAFVGKIVPNSGSLTNGLGLTTDGYPKGGMKKKGVLPQPRIGFAWDVAGDRKTVVRGGFGVTYDRYRSDVNSGANNMPFVVNPMIYYGYLSDIQPGVSGVLSPSAVNGVEENAKWPVIYSYSLGVQRELFKDTVIDVSYVGMSTRHNGRQLNLNQIPYGTTFTAAAQDPTKYSGGVVPATEPSLPSVYSAAGLSFSGANVYSNDFLRPYQGYGDITYRCFDANATYNSMQVSLQRRFAKSLSLGVAYTLSKTMQTAPDDTGTYTYPTNVRAYEYQLANFDRRNFLTANYVWTLPKGSKLIGENPLTRAVFDNWTISGITTIMSGNPAELGLGFTSVSDLGARLLGAPTGGSLSALQPRFYVIGSAQNAPNQIITSAFVVPGINDKGPWPRMYLKNPGYMNHDLTVSKNFPFGTEGNHYLQLRLEMYNFLNNNEWSGVNRSVSVVSNNGANSGNAIFNSYSNFLISNNFRPNGDTKPLGQYFGEWSSSQPARVIQLAAKFYF